MLPTLANIAKKILAIPASSAKSERVFSTGGNIVTAKRNRLAPKKVENLIVIKENMEKVDDFMTKGEYNIKKTDSKAFDNIEVEQIDRVEDDIFYLGGDYDDLEDEEIFFIDDSDDESEDDDEEDEVSENSIFID